LIGKSLGEAGDGVETNRQEYHVLKAISTISRSLRDASIAAAGTRETAIAAINVSRCHLDQELGARALLTRQTAWPTPLSDYRASVRVAMRSLGGE
jgi:hypothetical protein